MNCSICLEQSVCYPQRGRWPNGLGERLSGRTTWRHPHEQQLMPRAGEETSAIIKSFFRGYLRSILFAFKLIFQWVEGVLALCASAVPADAQFFSCP